MNSAEPDNFVVAIAHKSAELQRPLKACALLLMLHPFHATENAPRSAMTVMSDTIHPDSPHVLVVDDDADTREMVEMVLRQSGFRVSSAMTVTDALEQTRELKPDIITTDLGQRGGTLDGCELTTRLKASPDTQTIPVIAVTGWTRGFDRDRALMAGCDAVLSKPCSPDVLIAEICRLLNARKSDFPPA
jgi:two-component system cell cycle response regulator DivK